MGPDLRRIVEHAVTGDPEAAAALLRDVRRRGDDRVLSAVVEGEHTSERWRVLCRLLEAGIGDAGLVDAALDAAGWPDALRRAPLRWLHAVENARPPRWLPIVRAIDVRGVSMMHRVVRSPGLRAVTHLRVAADGNGDAAIAYLADADPLPLTRLDLIGCGVSARGIRALAASATGRGLRGIRLDDNRLAPAGTRALCAATFPQLERLELRRSTLVAPETLASASWWPGLRALALAGNDAVEPLLPALPPALTTLELGPLSADETRALGDAGTRTMRELAVVDTRLDASAIAAWARAPWRAGLRLLRIDGCTVSDTASEAIADALRGTLARVALDGAVLSPSAQARLIRTR